MGEVLWSCMDQVLAYRTARLGGPNVTVQAKNLAHLEREARKCTETDVTQDVVVDADHVLLPHPTGAPMVAALGIGPSTKAQCRHITKRFRSVWG